MTDRIGKLFDVAEQFRPLGRPIMTATQDFDTAMDGGIRGGEMITISGPSGEGKTSYAVWLTKQINDSGVPCLWFTYEMNPWYLKEKFKALGADESLNTFVPLLHYDNSPGWITDVIQEGIEKHACKVVFIDHLHYLIPTSQERNSSILIGGVARSVKQIAVNTDAIIYLIAHMRRLQQGEGVNVNAIRDSALIANESDYVYLIERLKKKKESYKTEELPLEFVGDDTTDISRISLAKNRRTGKMLHRLFQVQNGAFNQIPKDQYKLYE